MINATVTRAAQLIVYIDKNCCGPRMLVNYNVLYSYYSNYSLLLIMIVALISLSLNLETMFNKNYYVIIVCLYLVLIVYTYVLVCSCTILYIIMYDIVTHCRRRGTYFTIIIFILSRF